MISQQGAAMTTVDALLESVRTVAPIIRKHAREAEKERRLSAPVVEALLEAGLYRMWRPKALGGFEVDPVTALRVIEAISRADSAAGWNIMLSNGGDMFGAWFSDSVAKEMFGGADRILAGSFNPPRRAVPVEGGYRVTGKTSFNSGIREATWVVGFANIFDGDTPREGADGKPIMLLTAAPAGEVEIVDNWNTMGMCGTGSHDVVMTDLFVPEERAVVWKPLETRSEIYGGPLYRLTIWPAAASLAAPALGLARAALDGLLEVAKLKTPAYTEKVLKDRSVIQSQIAQAEAKLGAARAYLYQAFDEAYSDAIAGNTITMDRKCKIQLAATHAILGAAETVDIVHAAVGASGIRREYDFEKHFRDVHVITQHAFTSASRYESVGQIMMGFESEWPFFAF